MANLQSLSPLLPIYPFEMPTKRKRAIVEQPRVEDASAEPIELVVRRGALWRFNALKKKTADLPVTVVWDRRQTDRRKSPGGVQGERRAADRRQKPPFTWEVADFVVVGQAPRQLHLPAEAKAKV